VANKRQARRVEPPGFAMLNLTRLHLGIAHESQFQGLGITRCLRNRVQARGPSSQRARARISYGLTGISAGLAPLRNPADISTDLTMHIRDVDPAAHQSAGFDGDAISLMLYTGAAICLIIPCSSAPTLSR
jgi:hypothetical protein